LPAAAGSSEAVGAGVALRGAETAGILKCVFTCAGGESARRPDHGQRWAGRVE